MDAAKFKRLIIEAYNQGAYDYSVSIETGGEIEPDAEVYFNIMQAYFPEISKEDLRVDFPEVVPVENVIKES